MNKKLSDLILSTQSNLVINSELAVRIGLNEAVVLRQIYYWLEINEKLKRNYHDGKYWSYNTMENWRKENFPWWSTKTVERAFKNLVNSGLVITGNYNKDSRDRTKWYSIDEDVLEKVLKDTVEISTSDCPCANRQNDEMHTDNSTEALPETTYREHYTENTDKDCTLSSTEGKTLPSAGKGVNTSSPSVNITTIPPRTREQKEERRKQIQNSCSLNYKDEHLPVILSNEFESLYGDKEDIFKDHDICLTMTLICNFFKKFKQFRGERHPIVFEKDVDQFLHMVQNTDLDMAKDEMIEEDEELDYYLDMMDEFFGTDIGQNNKLECDYHIWLFFTEKTQNILYNRVKQKRNE